MLPCYSSSRSLCSYPEIHRKLHLKHAMRKKYRTSGKQVDLTHLKVLRASVKPFIFKSRKGYLAIIESATLWNRIINTRDPAQPSPIFIMEETVWMLYTSQRSEPQLIPNIPIKYILKKTFV